MVNDVIVKTLKKKSPYPNFRYSINFWEKRLKKATKQFNQDSSCQGSLSYKILILNVRFTGRWLLNEALGTSGMRQPFSPTDTLLMVALATRAGSEFRAPSPTSCPPITSTNILHEGPCSHLLYGPTNKRHIERHELQGAGKRIWDFFFICLIY